MLSALEPIFPLWLQIAIASLWVGLVMITAWGVSHFTDSQPEIIRKIVHIGTGNVILLAWWLNIPAFVGITAAILASIITLLSYIFPLLPGINSVGRRSLGTFFYAMSIGILVAWFWNLQQPQYAALGGQRFGKHKYMVLGSQKSWEGSLTMTLVSYIVSSLVLLEVAGNIWQVWIISLIVALISTALETISFLGIDNLTVPLGSAALSYILIGLLVAN